MDPSLGRERIATFVTAMRLQRGGAEFLALDQAAA
jgi:hypothetical protein